MSRSILIAMLVSATLTASCATSPPRNALPPPPAQDAPLTAQSACRLPTVPAEGPLTWADLETAYLARGLALIECDQARRLAIEAHQAERSAVQQWLQGLGDGG